MQNILVTGSRGFIGSNLVKYLRKNGFEIVEFDKLIHQDMDITSFESLHARLKDFEPSVVIHLAANANPKTAIDNPHLDLSINTFGTLNLIRAIRELETHPYLVFVSSAYVYGELASSPVSERQAPNPTSPYGISKLAAESYVRFFGRKYNLSYSILRFFNIFGPGQSMGYVVPDLMSKISNVHGPLESVELRGNPDDTRDFLFIEDLLNLFGKLLDIRPHCETFNVGSGVPTAIKDLATVIANTLGYVNLRVTSVNDVSDPPSLFYSDPSKVQGALNWQSNVSLDQGIRQIVDQSSLDRTLSAVR
ncbi:MAG: NAD-dependent epimerase/dehydratase family protein [Nitrososphaerales archaeon]